MASPSSESRARTVCLTCGDKRNEELLIYCINCQDSATHIYCLDNLSSIDGQALWRCWDSRYRLNYFSSIDEQICWKCWHCAPKVSQRISSRKSERISVKTDRATDARMELEKKLYSKSSCTGRKFATTNHGMVEKAQLAGESSLPVLQTKNSSDGNDGNTKLMDSKRKSSLKEATNFLEKFDKVEAQFFPSTSNISDIGLTNPKGMTNGITESAQSEGDPSASVNRMKNVQSFPELPKYEKLNKRRRRLVVVDSCSSEEDHPTNVKESSRDFQGCNGPVNTSNRKRRLMIDDSSSSEEQEDHPINVNGPIIVNDSCSYEEDHLSNVKESSIYFQGCNDPVNTLNTKRRPMLDDSRCSEEEYPINVGDSSSASRKYVGTMNTSNCQLLSEPRHELFAHHVWRGSFSITCKKKQTNLGILAHLSRKACSKVSDRAAMLPPELVVEVLAKRSAWPKRFQNVSPTDGSIDLYLFPECKRYERVYDGLVVDMIEADQALKVMVKDLELLIFSSRELPLEHWRFKGEYYLWGVFQKMHSSVPVNTSSNEIMTPFKQWSQSGNISLTQNKVNPDRTFRNPICCSPSTNSNLCPNTRCSAFLPSRSSSQESSVSSCKVQCRREHIQQLKT